MLNWKWYKSLIRLLNSGETKPVNIWLQEYKEIWIKDTLKSWWNKKKVSKSLSA